MPFVRQALAAVPIAATYFVAASLSKSFDPVTGEIPFLWSATAIVIADLCLRPRNRWAERLPAFLIASLCATIFFGRGVAAAIPTGLADMVEAVIAARLLLAWSKGGAPIGSLAWTIRFVIPVGIVAPMAIGTCMATISVATGFPPITVIPGIVAGHAFGNICFTPLVMLLRRGAIANMALRMRSRTKVEAYALFGLVVIVSALVFGQDDLPLLFLPILPLILVSFRLGHAASGLALAMVALIGTVLTLAGSGPIHLIEHELGQQLLFLQFYFAATILTILPVGADLEIRSKLHRQMRRSEERYRMLADHSSDVILSLGIDGTIRYVSPACRQMGYEPEDLVGRNCSMLIAPEHLAQAAAAHRRSLKLGGETNRFEYLALNAHGKPRWHESNARLMLKDNGQPDGILSIVRDIHAQKLIEQQLSDAARTDALTGLMNRRAFDEAVAMHPPGEGAATACVAMLDIDHFKQVNDRYGHDAGDIVLRGFADVARRIVREGDMVARIGGEEFAFYFPDTTLPQALAVCDRLRSELGRTIFRSGHHPIAVTVSGGVAELGPGGIDAALKVADMALYRAKQAGRNQLALAA